MMTVLVNLTNSNSNPKPGNITGTRDGSPVSAERYDPEADDDDDDKVIYPKTDEQRERLAEAVCGILLFRCLEPEQMQDVIDAMFEKDVNLGNLSSSKGTMGITFTS